MLKEIYCNDIVPVLIDTFHYKNIMQVPKLVKVCVNVGVGNIGMDVNKINEIINDLLLIAGQKPVVTYAKKSIAGFKVRKHDLVGCKVTLRKLLMYIFLEKLIYIGLPREKGFKGFTLKQFDGNGNLSFGIREQVIFSEIKYEQIKTIFGMDVTVVTNSNSDVHAKFLLSQLGFPFVEL